MLMGRSPGYAAAVATLLTIICSWFVGETPMKSFADCISATVTGMKNTLLIGATVGIIGIIVGVVELSGVGLQFAETIMKASSLISFDFLGSISFIDAPAWTMHFQKIITVLLVALASLILGMGVPVTASYLIMAVLVASFDNLGIALIAAHEYLLVEPGLQHHTPVCVAAYAGAAIAKADPWKTAWTAFRYAKMLYLVPILFVLNPNILMIGTWQDITLSFIEPF